MRYVITKNHTREYADPIAFERGESILREREDPQQPGWWWCTDKRGKSGWVHETYFEFDDGRYLGTEDYNALELTVKAGDKLDSIDERSGWALCSNASGEVGWVPLQNVEAI